jgi:hypothetical protein
MTRFLIATVAAALLATAAPLSLAWAQPAPGREPPNPDTDRDGKVTLAEFKVSNAQRQDRMFARMDANKDGKITQAEADAAAKTAEAAGRGGRGGGMLMRMDANADGAVTKAELAAMSDRRFQMADTNKDGWLSKGELLMMRQRRGGAGAQ